LPRGLSNTKGAGVGGRGFVEVVAFEDWGEGEYVPWKGLEKEWVRQKQTKSQSSENKNWWSESERCGGGFRHP